MVWQKNYGAPGTAPGTLAPPDAAPHVLVTAVHYTEEDYTETQVTDLEAYLQTAPHDGVFWFNVDGLGDIQVLETLGAYFHLHPLSLEDVLHIPQRAKIEDYEHYQFLVFHMPLLDPAVTGETEQVTLFLGRSFVLTFQERPGSDLFESVRSAVCVRRVASSGRVAPTTWHTRCLTRRLTVFFRSWRSLENV